MGRHFIGHKQLVARKIYLMNGKRKYRIHLTRVIHRSGQSTVEYAIVFAAFLVLVLALGVLWRPFDTGLVVQHALQSASHHVKEVSEGALLDVFLY